MLLPCTTLGDPTHPAILFLHGFLGRGSDWLSAAQALAARHFCILPDLPGHGEASSLRPPGETLSFQGIAARLVELLDSLQVARPGVVGYSERVAALVLESASPGIQDQNERQARARLDDQRADRIRAVGMQQFLDEWVQMDLFQSLRQHPERLADLQRRRSRNHPEWAAQVIADLSPGRQPAVWDCLPGLDLPVCLLAGALDSKYTRLVLEMGALIPGAEVHISPDAGHNVHVERPEWVLQQLSTFFSGLDRAR
jgi:2-succinyl-6-hydroxy-2,4-cyclohexadiene-1-carboxylate synthase